MREQAKGSIFLTRLLGVLVGWPRFCFVIGLAGLTVGLAISEAELTGGEVTFGFLG